MTLLLETREWCRLDDFVRQAEDSTLQAMSHFVTEPVAKKLEKQHHDLAGRLWLAQAMRIVEGGKSRYYFAALSNVGRARGSVSSGGLAYSARTSPPERRGVCTKSAVDGQDIPIIFISRFIDPKKRTVTR